MPVQAFLQARKRAKKEIDTLQYNIRQAYNLAEASTIGNDGLVDLSALSQAGALQTFENSFINYIEQEARKYLHVARDAQLDNFARNRILMGYLGISSHEVNRSIEGLGPNMSFDNFMKQVGEKLTPTLENLAATPFQELSANDSQEVINYTNTANKVDSTKLRIQDMAELIMKYEQEGVIGDRFLQNKHYNLVANQN